MLFRSHGLEYETVDNRTLVVVVPGEHRLRTSVSFCCQDTAVSINAFVIRHPDENEANVFRWLLEMNRRMYGLSYCLDHHGDVYLSGRVPIDSFDEVAIDRVLGTVVEYTDRAFNTLLELGFADSIRREWAWRQKSGLNTDNLQAFTHLFSENPTFPRTQRVRPELLKNDPEG